MKKKQIFWKKYGFACSKNRLIVLKSLKKPSNPSQISQRTDIGMNMTSRALRDLEREGIIECKNPKAKVGRIYDLTSLGMQIIKKIKD